MNYTKTARALAMGAIACGLVTQAGGASAFVRCRANWPATITQCDSNTTSDKGTGSGRNSGGTNRTVTAFLSQGTVSATAAALNANGQNVCATTDNAPIDGASVSRTCAVATVPTAIFLTAE